MRTLSTHAQCAKLIRQELKKAYPQIKFKVTSEHYAGGNSVDIYYDDGVNKSKIDELVSKFMYGEFNSEDDSYSYNNVREDIPQVKFISVTRNYSPQTKEKLAKALAERYGVSYQSMMDNFYFHTNLREYSSTLIWREFCKNEFV